MLSIEQQKKAENFNDKLYEENLKLATTARDEQKSRSLLYAEYKKSDARVKKLRGALDEAHARIRQLEKLVSKQQHANNALQTRCLHLKSKAKTPPKPAVS